MTYRPPTLSGEGRTRFPASHGHYAIAYHAALLEAELSRRGAGKSRFRQPPADVGDGDLRRGWRCPVVRWGRGCPLPQEWRSRAEAKVYSTSSGLHNSMSMGS